MKRRLTNKKDPHQLMSGIICNPKKGNQLSLALDKLAAYEDAEEAGYIKRCPKCGGFRVTELQGSFVGAGFNKICRDCKEKF